MSKMSIPIEKMNFESYENDDRFIKARIYVMHDGKNLNNSIFSMESIEKAKNTISNIPILCFIKNKTGSEERDFGGHEFEIVVDKNNNTVEKYLGVPIGLIPQVGNNYHYEIIDERNYVVVDGYIWSDYAKDSLDIIKENGGMKGHSMEIKIDNFDFTEFGELDITNYRYKGLCLLGDNIKPAMEKSRLELFSSTNFKNEFSEMVFELQKILSEVKDLAENEIKESIIEENQIGEEIPVVEETPVVEENQIDDIENGLEVEETPSVEEVPIIEGNNESEVEEPIIEETPIEEEKVEVRNFEEEISQLNIEIKKLMEENAKLNSQLNDFQKKEEFDEKKKMLDKYLEVLEKEEISDISSKFEAITLKELEENLKTLATNKLFAINSVPKDENGGKQDLPKSSNKNRYAL